MYLNCTADIKEVWSCLDAILLRWIYNTISRGHLITFLNPDVTTKQAWKCQASIVQDNKKTLYLEHDQVTRFKLDVFPNVSDYCHELKTIVVQLGNVGALILEDDLSSVLIKTMTT